MPGHRHAIVQRLSASRCSALPPSVCSDPATQRRDQRKQPATPVLEKKRERMSQGLQPGSRPEPPLPANPHPPANGQPLSQNVKCKSTSSSPCNSSAAAAQPKRALRLFSPITVPSQTSRSPSSSSRTCQECVSRNTRATRCAPPLSRLCCCQARSQMQEKPSSFAQVAKRQLRPLPRQRRPAANPVMQPYHTAHACRQPSAQRHKFVGWPHASRHVSYSVAYAAAQIASLVSTYA